MKPQKMQTDELDWIIASTRLTIEQLNKQTKIQLIIFN